MMGRGRILILLMFLSVAAFSQAIDTAFTNLIKKGDEYATLYYHSATLFKPPVYSIIYSNEQPDNENLSRKFKLDDDTTSISVGKKLMLCFKYLNQKGYTLVSSTGTVVNSIYYEFYFVRPRKDGKK